MTVEVVEHVAQWVAWWEGYGWPVVLGLAALGAMALLEDWIGKR